MSVEEVQVEDRAGGIRLRKWVVGIAAALALVIVGGAVTLKLLFPPEKLRALVVPQIESRVGREVQLSSVHLRIFPRVAVRLEELAIANPAGFSQEPALRVEALDLQLRFWPLIHRQIELGQVRLLRPTIRYEVRADGTSNFEGLGSSAGAERAALDTATVDRAARDRITAGEAAAAASFVVEDLALLDGTFLVSDEKNGRGARLSVDGRLSATRDSTLPRALRSEGEFDLRSIRALVPDLSEDSVALPDISIEYAAFADLPGDSIALSGLNLAVGDVPLDGSGAVRGLGGTRSIDFALASGDVSIAEVLAGLPTRLRPADVEASGIARVSLTARGELGGDEVPAIEGTIQLEQVSGDYGDYGRLLSNGQGEVRVDPGSLSLAPFKGDLLGRPFELALTVTDFKSPALSGRVNGSIDLARIGQLRQSTQPMAGEVAFDLDVSGQAKDLASLQLAGPVRLSNVSYQSTGLAVPARVPSATLQLTGRGIRSDAIPVELGGSDLTLSLTSRDLLGWALTRGEANYLPFVEFAATSQRLDYRELSVDTDSIGYSELVTARLAGRRLEGREPGEIARERYEDIALPPVNASGRVEIGELINPPTRARDIGFEVTVNNGVLEIKELRGEVYGGQLTGGLVLDFSGGEPPFTLRYDLSLSAAQADNFINRWTRLGSALSGLVDFDISGSSVVDETLLPSPAALDATGEARFREGRFLDFGLTRALANQFKLDAGRLSNFRELGGAFAIEGGAFLIDGWDFSAPDIKGGVSGSAGLGGSLDLQLALEIPPSTLQKAGLIQSAGGLAEIVSQLAGDDEAINVSVAVGGTMSSPTLTLDSEALREALAERLQDTGQGLLDRLLKKKKEPPPD